jgi:hypothetical protein
MSIQIMNAVWRESKSKGRARLVLLSIADHQGELGAWPSIETLAKMVNSSPRSVQRDIQDLIELGELVVEFRSAPTYGPYKANRYFVNLPGVTDGVSEVTKTASEVTDSESEVTESASEVTAGGVLTLNRTLKETLTKQADESFETFWNLYPKKVAKADALKAWKQVLKKKTADEMIGITKAYSESKLPDMTYIPYPASWLNKGLYEAVENDKPAPASKPIFGRIK